MNEYAYLRRPMSQTQILSDVSRYIDKKRHLTLDDMRPEYEGYLRIIRRFGTLTPATRILEIGTGTGWFPLLCKRDNLQCKGLEISQQLIDYARELGANYGIEPDIELGNIEEVDMGAGIYDAVFANSVFEHVQHWRPALERVYRALKPGGIFFFASTNKFSLGSDEYPPLPVYGWLPDQWRYRLRVAVQGPDIMNLGIDFNQFTYWQLRKAFREAGFSRAWDRIELVEPERFSGWKRQAVNICKAVPLVKWPVLLFCDATTFVCIK
jgi:2-polyprenyl-3-methyl-5-hydroxy-6-metoxy-1,4-benzoquinol methylase